jgi:16S rRNA processing protein RimM
LSSAWSGRDAAHAVEKKILKVRIDPKQLVLCIQGIESVEDTEQLLEAYVFVPEHDAVQLQKGTYFIHDVIGCDVVTEENENVGIITDVLALPSNDVWIVKKGMRELLIPAVKAIIRQVNVQGKRITIHAVDGLLE